MKQETVSRAEMIGIGFQYACGLYLKEEVCAGHVFIHIVRALPDGTAPVGGQYYTLVKGICA